MPYEPTRWTLDALIPSADPAAIDQALTAFEKKVKKVEGWRKKLKPTLAVADFDTLVATPRAQGTLLAFHSIFGDEDGQLTAVGGNLAMLQGPYHGIAYTRGLADDE